MTYRRLSILEIVYSNNDGILDVCVEDELKHKISTLSREFICVSVVVGVYFSDIIRFLSFIKFLRNLNIPVSISCYSEKMLDCLEELKGLVGQIRIFVNIEKDATSIIEPLYKSLKAPQTNIVFLFELSHVSEFKMYERLLETQDYIYNISYNSSIGLEQYWNLAEYVSALKMKYPMKIFQEFTCAGVKFNNLKGICPARTSLMCIGVDGNISYCYKDTQNHGINIKDGELERLFEKLDTLIPKCKNVKCSEADFTYCMCGCPLDIEDSNNLYCIHNKGGVML